MILAVSFYNFNWIWIGIAILTLFGLQFLTAPYGRHSHKKWGPMINNKLAWFIMEIVVLLVFAYFFFRGSLPKTIPTWIFFACFGLHYLNRSIIYPLRIRTKGKQMPLIIMLSAVLFNLVNGYINGHNIGAVQPYSNAWLAQPQFIIGILIFITGAAINIYHDNILIKLRKPGETAYKIPQQGLFEQVSCPNIFGEIIEWIGFALMTWSLPGLAFAIWTFCNLVPRAKDHHKWYKEKFKNYPLNRKAVFPFLY